MPFFVIDVISFCSFEKLKQTALKSQTVAIQLVHMPVIVIVDMLEQNVQM